MKKLYFILVFFLAIQVFSQSFYEQQWKKIESQSKKGMFKSNLPLIIEIQNKAIEEHNLVQVIKSLKEEYNILHKIEDDTKNDQSSQFFKKIRTVGKSFKGENKVLFDILTAQFILNYAQNNHWKIRDRVSVDNPDLGAIETWSPLDFKKYLKEFYQEKVKQDLSSIALKEYVDIFTSEEENWDYYPTIKEIFILEYISFLRNPDFFTENEIKGHKKLILSLYDEGIINNRGNAKLNFQHKKLNFEYGEKSSEEQLKALQDLYSSDEQGDYKVWIASEIMRLLSSKGENKKAIDLADIVKKQYPKSKFINTVINVETSIKTPVLYLFYEEETLPNKPIHIVAETKNVEDFALNIYKLQTKDMSDFISYTYKQNKAEFDKINKKLVRKEHYKIIPSENYEHRKTSLEMKPLPSGVYIVESIVSGKVQGRFYFLATENKLLYHSKSSHSNDVIHWIKSESGKKITDTTIEIFEYSYLKKPPKKYSFELKGNGTFEFPNQGGRYGNSPLFIVKEKDTENYNIFANAYKYRPNVNENASWQKSRIFIDRQIYRPGQRVYFKVINTVVENHKERINKSDDEISLFDANNQLIETQKFRVNSFGSYSGSFILPKGKLNGIFSLSTKSKSYQDFSVEEYKAPKFEVSFEPLKSEYQLGQTIDIKGKAISFSGVPLSNAKVVFTIKKQDITYKYFGYPQYSNNENTIIKETKTDDKGVFSIPLLLEKEEQKGKQVDDYIISAEVTDINGETQSENTNIRVASVSHYINVTGESDIFSSQDAEFKVKTLNYSNQNLNKPYHITLSKYPEDRKIYRNNFKNVVQDSPQMSLTEFDKKFPNDRYNFQEKKADKVVLERHSQKGENLNLGKLAIGKYLLEIYNIEEKDTIKTTHYFEVWDKNLLAKNQKPFFKVIPEKKEYARTDKATFKLYSGIKEAVVYVFIQNGDGETLTEQVKLKEGFLSYTLKLPEDKSINTLNVQFQLVAFNDVQTHLETIKIKSDEEKLQIETLTFRDKLEPNKKEKWSFKIKGNDRMQTEVLASMYDKSLDRFRPSQWHWNAYTRYRYYNSYSYHRPLEQYVYSEVVNYLKERKNIYPPYFNWFKEIYSLGGISSNLKIRGASSLPYSDKSEMLLAENASQEKAIIVEPLVQNTEPQEDLSLSKVNIRQNLNETAFFYPQLYTDKEGNISFEFTSPEALTQWKFRLLAHTQNLKNAILEKEVITQKQLSVTPNYPRFLREGDKLKLQTKVSSLVDEKLSGVIQLQILNTENNMEIDNIILDKKTRDFSLGENATTVVDWELVVPKNISSVIIKVVATAGNYSDGEQKAVYVLPNRMLVTEALPIFVKEGQTKTFTLENLKKSQSNTLVNYANTLELTTNPIWEIMFALPSLKNNKETSTDALFNKWFAGVLASEIFRANPKLKTVLEEYRDKDLLQSNLNRNQELKQLILEETPWVLESKSEEEQMQRIALLFDVNSMKNQINEDWRQWTERQNSDGGFSWQQGYPSSFYISLDILKNWGRINEWLKGDLSGYSSSESQKILANLIRFVDNKMVEFKMGNNEIWSNLVLDYLNTRHYWEKKFPIATADGQRLKAKIKEKAKSAKIQYFTFYGLHRSALLFDAYGMKSVSKKFLNYLKETAVNSETQGVYWKKNWNDWGWYNTQIVNHSGALEAFGKLDSDKEFVEELKIWLATQKEVSSWGSFRSTAEVIFTMLQFGKSWTLPNSEKVEISWGGKEISPQPKATGYVKQQIVSQQINKNLAQVTLKKQGAGIVQGGLYWQYYEDLDKIKSSESYLSITKEWYKKVKTENGEVLQKITEKEPLKIGDKLTVRMILNTDRDMEFVHIKDMRASGVEPLQTISGYYWKNGLAFYQVTKDTSTNFYIESMKKGKYVFEYDLICNISGEFSSGITTIQNYYAPQMNSNTQGRRLKISD